jgi:hypothetical protein
LTCCPSTSARPPEIFVIFGGLALFPVDFRGAVNIRPFFEAFFK